MYWDIIPMPDTVTGRFNILGTYQQDLFLFTDRKDHLIGDGAVDLTGVDEDGDENKSSLTIENENDLDYQEGK